MDAFGLVLLAAALGLVVQTLRLGRRWQVGQPVAVDLMAGLRRLPRAYLHTVHEVVARDPYASRMHMLAAGGLLAAVLLSAARHVLGLGGAVASGLVVVAVVAGLVGAGLVAWRRRPPRPRRLSGGRFDRLAPALAGVLLSLLLATMWPLPAALLGAVCFGVLVLWTVDGPLRHAVAGVAHLLAHSRPARFEDRISADLKPLDLSDASPARLGAASAGDFGWNRLAQFDACVQCGRCQEVCPAFAAGQPLNPKALIQDLVRATGSQLALVDAIGRPGAIAPDALWACTTCRACVYECPMLIEHVDAIVDLRRYETLERGTTPPGVATVLAEIRDTDTVAGRALDSRLDWAADLALPLLAEAGQADILLWLGEAAFDRRNQRSLRALVTLLRQAGVDFGVLGAAELDCGDLARRLGDEVTFQDLARRNVATLARRRFGTILTMDPHALHVLRHEYPAFGGQYRVMHHSEFLDRLLAEGRLTLDPARAAGAVTYHDPCYLGRYNGEVAAPRRLLERLGLSLLEMPRSGMRSHCCGSGGGAAIADIPGRARIPDQRMDQVRATGAPTLAVGCPNCAQMLEGVVGQNPAVADLAELVLAAVDLSTMAARRAA